MPYIIKEKKEKGDERQQRHSEKNSKEWKKRQM